MLLLTCDSDVTVRTFILKSKTLHLLLKLVIESFECLSVPVGQEGAAEEGRAPGI